MILFALIPIKFLLYWLIFKRTPALLSLEVINPSRFAWKWASVRLGVGLLFGIVTFLCFWALSNKGVNTVAGYAMTFGVSRYLEWSIVYSIMMRRYGGKKALFVRKAQQWIGMGVACNVALDIAILMSGLTDHLRFVC